QPGERRLNQATADIMALYYYDRLLHSPGLLEGTLRPNRKFIYAEPAEELYPLLDRILPAGWEVSMMPENQPEHFLPRAQILDTLPTRTNPGVMDITLDDDVVGIVPQIPPTVIETMLKELHRHNLSGFTARERFPGDHDAILAYMGRVAWDANATPDTVTRDLVTHVCAEECAGEMLTAMHQVE